MEIRERDGKAGRNVDGMESAEKKGSVVVRKRVWSGRRKVHEETFRLRGPQNSWGPSGRRAWCMEGLERMSGTLPISWMPAWYPSSRPGIHRSAWIPESFEALQKKLCIQVLQKKSCIQAFRKKKMEVWHPSRHLHTSLASKHLESVPGMATAIIQAFALDGGSS